jgi:putative component of membrane protein insertase Oxa1/YidC/SpoIIIJ protein YidD
VRFILLFLIRIYWISIPITKRRKCLFNESCSNHVYRITKEKGLIKGIVCLVRRIKQCKPGYKLEINDNFIRLHLIDGSILNESEISEIIVSEIKIKVFNTIKT